MHEDHSGLLSTENHEIVPNSYTILSLYTPDSSWNYAGMTVDVEKV